MPTTPHSAAGWRIEPPVSEPSASGAKPAATAAALPPLEPPGHPGRVVGVAGRTEGRVLGRGAHGELVEVRLADDDRAGRAPAARRRWRRTAGASPRGSSTSRWWATPRVQRLSLRATGTPASGPGSSPAATRRVDGIGRGAGLVGEDEVEGVELRLARVDGGEVLLERRRARCGPPAATAVRPTCNGVVTAPHRGSAGTLNRSVLDLRRRGQHLVAVDAGPTTSAPAARCAAGTGATVGGTSARSSASTSAAWSRTAASWR